MAMNNNKHKAMSVLFTTFIIFTLVLMGPANAITIDISEPSDANQGEDVEFTVTVDLDTPDMYLPIAYTTLIFTEPSGDEFECKVYNDGSTNCDNIDVTTTFDLTYGQGVQFGYGYGYQPSYGYGYEYTYFGYGYGYGYAGENGQITYDVTLHLDGDSEIGTYNVKAETYVASEDSIDSPYSPCEIMLGRYQGYYVLMNQEGSYYDPALDLNEDGTIDLSDIVIFAADHYDDAELYGRFQEFMRFEDNQTFDPALDLNDDGIINLSDIVLFAGNQEEAWCAAQLDLIEEGVERIYISNEVEFTVSSVPEDDPVDPPIGTSGRTSTRSCDDGYERIGGKCVLIEQPEEESTEVEEVIKADDNLNTLAEETFEEQQGGVFGAITGAVVGAGESIGLGETTSYLFTLFLLGMIIVGSTRRFRKKPE